METAPVRVLIIDDDQDTATVTCEILSLYGFRVCIAQSGAGGILEAARFLPDVALIDIRMPDIDGYAVAKTLRATIASQSTILIAYTGYSRHAILGAAMKHGFDYVLQKPSGIEDLVGVIAELTQVSAL
nr:response regulator [uncultured Duganella sp.]